MRCETSDNRIRYEKQKKRRNVFQVEQQLKYLKDEIFMAFVVPILPKSRYSISNVL